MTNATIDPKLMETALVALERLAPVLPDYFTAERGTDENSQDSKYTPENIGGYLIGAPNEERYVPLLIGEKDAAWVVFTPQGNVWVAGTTADNLPQQEQDAFYSALIEQIKEQYPEAKAIFRETENSADSLSIATTVLGSEQYKTHAEFGLEEDSLRLEVIPLQGQSSYTAAADGIKERIEYWDDVYAVNSTELLKQMQESLTQNENNALAAALQSQQRGGQFA